MAHTPGPWVSAFGERSGYDCMTDAFQILEPSGTRITSVDLGNYGQSSRTSQIAPEDKERAQSDAQLIAAAPELLAALRLFVDQYTRLINSGDCGNWNPETDEEVITARAAIAKAEGR